MEFMKRRNYNYDVHRVYFLCAINNGIWCHSQSIIIMLWSLFLYLHSIDRVKKKEKEITKHSARCFYWRVEGKRWRGIESVDRIVLFCFCFGLSFLLWMLEHYKRWMQFAIVNVYLYKIITFNWSYILATEVENLKSSFIDKNCGNKQQNHQPPLHRISHTMAGQIDE